MMQMSSGMVDLRGNYGCLLERLTSPDERERERESESRLLYMICTVDEHDGFFLRGARHLGI